MLFFDSNYLDLHDCSPELGRSNLEAKPFFHATRKTDLNEIAGQLKDEEQMHIEFTRDEIRN